MRHCRYTIVQKPGSLGRKSAEDGVIMIESRSEYFLVRGERIHGETLTVDVRCSSGKDAYPTYAAAERALRMRSLNGKRTKRIYRCEECGYYHFTTNDGTAAGPARIGGAGRRSTHGCRSICLQRQLVRSSRKDSR